MSEKPNFVQMIRAPFLSSILAPLLAGTLLAVHITGRFYLLEALLVLIIGLCLHIATNVYNDIHDTLQGTDRVNLHRNEFSGGSGILLEHPNMMPRMRTIARGSLVIALVTAAALTFRLSEALRPVLWAEVLLSAFFSKYYTAAPVKLAYRGWGEVSVWFAFGPMAILLAALGQHVGFHPWILLLMPATGLSTGSILLIGQLIDRDADETGGKWGAAVRLGTKFTSRLYLAVQATLILNILACALIIDTGWPVLIALLPYLLLFPQAWLIVREHHTDPPSLKQAAGVNVQIHLLFSLLLILGWTVTLLLPGG